MSLDTDDVDDDDDDIEDDESNEEFGDERNDGLGEDDVELGKDTSAVFRSASEHKGCETAVLSLTAWESLWTVTELRQLAV